VQSEEIIRNRYWCSSNTIIIFKDSLVEALGAAIVFHCGRFL